jgi:23S rRNA (uracil1939-C5)-methyltransferase
MAQHPDVRVDLQRMEFTGQARGKFEGKAVFVWGGLPGETLTARVSKRQRRSLSCVAGEIHVPSPHRIPPCEDHYLTCSPWQILSEEQELIFKASLVTDLFAQRFKLELPQFQVASGQSFAYRNKLEFSFTEGTDGLSLAFFQRESHRRKIELDGCLLGSDAINRAARFVRDVLRANQVTAGQLKSLVLRSNQAGHVAAALYVTEAIAPVCDRIADNPIIRGMRVFFSNPLSPASIASELLEETGDSVLEEQVLSKRFRYSDRSFFQVNIPMYEQAILAIRQFVADSELVYDLYAGVGTIGICCEGRHTVFIESDEDSARFLRENCERNGVQADIAMMPAEKAFDAIPRDACVILDPPRAGIHPRVLKRLMASPPQRLIYMSCNPQTQGQDLSILQTAYRLVHFSAFNFFPRTPRVETLAVLDRIADASASRKEATDGHG